MRLLGLPIPLAHSGISARIVNEQTNPLGGDPAASRGSPHPAGHVRVSATPAQAWLTRSRQVNLKICFNFDTYFREGSSASGGAAGPRRSAAERSAEPPRRSYAGALPWPPNPCPTPRLQSLMRKLQCGAAATLAPGPAPPPQPGATVPTCPPSSPPQPCWGTAQHPACNLIQGGGTAVGVWLATSITLPDHRPSTTASTHTRNRTHTHVTTAGLHTCGGMHTRTAATGLGIRTGMQTSTGLQRRTVGLQSHTSTSTATAVLLPAKQGACASPPPPPQHSFKPRDAPRTLPR